MENISKNTDIPRKRGRPPKGHLNNPLLAGVIDQMSPDIRTRRGKNNLYYGVFFGVNVIYDTKKKELKDPLFKFLFNPEENKFKKTILSALGRVAMEYGPEEAEILTREICKRKMSTGEALAFPTHPVLLPISSAIIFLVLCVSSSSVLSIIDKTDDSYLNPPNVSFSSPDLVLTEYPSFLTTIQILAQ